MSDEPSGITLLVISPNAEIRKSLCDFFKKKGYFPEEESNFVNGKERVRSALPFSCILADMDSYPEDSLQYVEELHQTMPETPIVVLTSKANVSWAVEIMKRGAYHVIQKPLLLKEAGEVVEEALSLVRKASDVHALLPYLTSQMLFELPGTLSQIESALDHLAEETLRWKIISPKDEAAFRSAVRCALHNAVIHGNKGDEKKKVSVNFILNEKSCMIAVTDEGLGFVPASYLQPKNLAVSRENMTSGLVRIQCFMDQVSFNERGNQIRMVKLAK